MYNPNKTITTPTYRLLAALLLAACASGSWAQADNKSIVAEPVPAFPVFNQWVNTVVLRQPEPVFTADQLQPVRLAPVVTAVQSARYEPLPVIVGAPELPLLASAAQQAARQWAPTFNYQGVHMQQVVMAAAYPGAPTKRELRPMGTPLRAGERFKIRISTTFDAVAEVDQVLGDAWNGVRTGQVYPQQGLSVQIRPGESVELPVGPSSYFQLDPSANPVVNQRLVVSVRHPGAQPGSASDQPAYRQDSARGSSYLQLVPSGKFPAMEQLVSQGQ